MDAKPISRIWYAGLDERPMELGKEDPEVYKHWHDWYKPKAERPLWLKPNSPESLEKLMEVLDTAIKERRWTHEPIVKGHNNTGPHALYEETAFVIVALGICGRRLAGCINVCIKGMSWG